MPVYYFVVSIDSNKMHAVFINYDNAKLETERIPGTMIIEKLMEEELFGRI